MSALGQKQTSQHVSAMSALPPKADIGQLGRDVRFVPKADMVRCAKDIAIRSPRRHETAVIVVLKGRALWRS